MIAVRIRSLLCVMLAAFIASCEPKPAPEVQLDIPDRTACIGSSGGVKAMFDAYRAGDTDAIPCDIAINQRRGELSFLALERRDLIYHLNGVEPEGLDALVRAMPRHSLAAKLRNMHNFEPSLEPFDTHWWTV